MAKRHQHNRAAFGNNGDIDTIANFYAGKIHQSSIEDDSLGIADLGDSFGHRCNTMFYGQGTARQKSRRNPSSHEAGARQKAVATATLRSR